MYRIAHRFGLLRQALNLSYAGPVTKRFCFIPHFRFEGYHPLFLFNNHGDCLAAKLRPGNVHSAEDWDELLLPEIERQQAEGKQVAFRADAAFAKSEIYEALEERGVMYAIHIPANDNLERDIAELLTRPAGRPSHKPVVWLSLPSGQLEEGAKCEAKGEGMQRV